MPSSKLAILSVPNGPVYCRISGFRQTMANRGYNSLVAIQLALPSRANEDSGE